MKPPGPGRQAPDRREPAAEPEGGRTDRVRLPGFDALAAQRRLALALGRARFAALARWRRRCEAAARTDAGKRRTTGA